MCGVRIGYVNNAVANCFSNLGSQFITAAMVSACRVVSARVATDVAIAFAASWKPFVKSKMNATAMMKLTRRRVSVKARTP